jgi:hypothetical protein
MVRIETQRFLKEHCKVSMFKPWAEKALRGQEGPNLGRPLPTPEWWKEVGAEDEPLSDEVLDRPEDLHDAFRHATCHTIEVLRQAPPVPVYTAISKIRVITAIIRTMEFPKAPKNLDDLLTRLVALYPPVGDYCERWVVKRDNVYVKWKIDVLGLRRLLAARHWEEAWIKQHNIRETQDGHTMPSTGRAEERNDPRQLTGVMLDFEGLLKEHVTGYAPTVQVQRRITSHKSVLTKIRDLAPSKRTKFQKYITSEQEATTSLGSYSQMPESTGKMCGRRERKRSSPWKTPPGN